MKIPAHNLETIERWMQAVIMCPSGVVAGIGSPESREIVDLQLSDLEELVAQAGALTSIQCLGIYNHAFFARLQECLCAEFPVLLHALGAELFNLFTLDYLRHYSPRSYTLNRLAENFPRHLADTRPDATGQLSTRESWPDFIIELATFERAFIEVFDGPGVEVQGTLSPDHLPERLSDAHLLPVVCLRLFSFNYPVSQYFTAVRNDQHPTIPEPSPTFLAITRRSYTVMVHELNAMQYATLTSLTAGLSLNELIDSSTINDMTSAAMWIREWAEHGFFSGIGDR